MAHLPVGLCVVLALVFHPMILGSLLWLVVGLGLLGGGGELLVRSASKIALRLGLAPLVVGLTIVAFGTSAPELGVSLVASLQGNPEVSLSNVVGSNIFNIGFILGLCALVTPLVVQLQLLRFDVPILIASSLLVLYFCFDGVVTGLEGLCLGLGLVAYTFWLIRFGGREPEAVKSEFEEGMPSGKNANLLVHSGLVAVSLGILVLGSRLLVQAAVALAQVMGVSDSLIGLTIVAVGTSLPEVATSLMATLRGQTDIAIGNVIGSNIFNLLLIIGVSAGLGSGLRVDPNLQVDLLVMVGMALVCFPLLVTARRLVRWEGLILLFSYVSYVAYLILRENLS